jgi:hypothetical protein
VTGQRSNQLSYTPAQGERDVKKIIPLRQGLVRNFVLEKSGQQTPRRWGWGTPLKKRAATRIKINVTFLRRFVNKLSFASSKIWHYAFDGILMWTARAAEHIRILPGIGIPKKIMLPAEQICSLSHAC